MIVQVPNEAHLGQQLDPLVGQVREAGHAPPLRPKLLVQLANVQHPHTQAGIVIPVLGDHAVAVLLLEFLQFGEPQSELRLSERQEVEAGALEPRYPRRGEVASVRRLALPTLLGHDSEDVLSPDVRRPDSQGWIVVVRRRYGAVAVD